MDDIIPTTCGECSTYPLHFHDLGFRCPRTREAVNFITTACPKQAELERSDEAIQKAKVHKFRKRLTTVSERLPETFKKYERRFAEGEHILMNKAGAAVYAVRCADYIKIGFTARYVKGRMQDLLHSNPFPLILVGVAPGTHRFENQLHRRFAKYRHRREWFHLDSQATTDLRQAIIDADGMLFDKPVEEL